MQQREAIRRAADAGTRPRISAQGSQLLPLRDDRLRSILLTRPNGQLTRAGQFYYSVTGRRPPSRQFDESQPLIRDGPSDYILLRSGRRQLVRTLQPDGQYHVTKLGKAFFKDKYTEWLAHVPVIIRGTRGRNAGNSYERHDYLPVTALEIGLSRQNDAWSEAQIARNVKEAVLRQLGQPEANEPIYMISGETYFLHPTNEWAYSSSSMQVIDNRVDTQIRLRQPLGALREVSYQLFAGDQILASAFEERPDMLCVPRQLAELLKLSLEDILQDFDAICSGDWRQRGVSPAEIRTFCVWRNAPMFFVDCRGRLLDCFQPMQKEERAIAYTAWNGHAFFYKSARAVVGCDEAERHRYRPQRQDSSTPEFSEQKPWAGEIGCGHFWSEDLRSVRAQLLAAEHQPKVALRGLCEWSALRLRASGGDCVIRELCEDAQVLQEWTQRLGVPYRGQRLAGASLEVFLHLLQRRRDNTSSRRAALLAEQDGMCKLCGAPITAQTCELDHIVPVRQAYQGQALELQALCFECHKVKTSMEGNHSTTLESRFSRYVYQNYAASPRVPPLVCQLQKWDAERPCEGIDVCRCRKNGLANARFPIPVFCPLDCIVPAREGELADLTYVDLPFDGRRGLLPAALCGQGMVLQARLCGDAGLRAGAVAPLSLEPGGHGARGPTLVGAGAADDGRGLAGRGGAHGQALHQRAGGALRPQPGPRLLHENFQSPGGWGGLQLAPDLHGCRGPCTGTTSSSPSCFPTAATARCTISSWGRSIRQWPGSDEPWRRCRSATSNVSRPTVW